MMQRNTAYDAIRSLAIVLVIGIHVLDGMSYSTTMGSNASIGGLSWTLQTVCMVLGRLGVPFFFFLSGALMLNRELEYDKDYLLKRVLPLYLNAVIWTFGYFLYKVFENHEAVYPVKLVSLFIRSCTLDRDAAPHLWYMSVIVAIYLFLPLMTKLVRICSTKMLINMAALSAMIFSFAPTFNRFLHVSEVAEAINFTMPNFRDGMLITLYPMYMLIGYLIKEREILKRAKSWMLALAGLACVGGVTLLQWECYVKKSTQYIYNLWYDNIFILGAGIAFFGLMSRLPTPVKPVKLVLTSLSRLSYGVYYIHFVLYRLFRSRIQLLQWALAPKVTAVVICTLLTSWGIVFILSKVPVVNRLLFNIRTTPQGRKERI